MQSGTGATYTFAGRTTGSNCVANETSVRLPVAPAPPPSPFPICRIYPFLCL